MSMRPLSSTTTATTNCFHGNYPKIVSVNSKVSMYKSDGTGRDTYIIKNNGGFAGANETPFRAYSSPKFCMAEAMKKPSVTCKVPIYKNNGFGRDTYISSSSGGFYKGEQTHHPSFFKQSLRNYEAKRAPKNNDFIYYSQNYVKKKYVPLLKEKATNQRLLSARLSSSTKKFY